MTTSNSHTFQLEKYNDDNLFKYTLDRHKTIKKYRTYEVIELHSNIKYSKNNSASTIQILRNAELCSIEYMRFETSLIKSIDEFKNIMNNYSCEITAGGNIIQKFNFSFLFELDPSIVTKNDKYFYVKIPHEITFGKLKLFMLEYYEVRLNVMHGDNFDDFSVLCKYTHLKKDDLCNMPKKCDKFFQQIQLIFDAYFCDQHKIVDNYKFPLHGPLLNGNVKGLFFYANISNIKSIKLLFDGVEKINYDCTMFDLFCNKLSDNLLYIPYNCTNIHNYKDVTLDSYVGSLNHNLIDSLMLDVTFKNSSDDYSKCKIYALNMNYFKYENGGVTF